MTNADKILRLRSLIAASDSAKGVVDATIKGLQLRSMRGVTNEDRSILDRLPYTVHATYQCADQWDSMLTRSRIRTCGSVVEAVTLELAAEQLREQRAGL